MVAGIGGFLGSPQWKLPLSHDPIQRFQSSPIIHIHTSRKERETKMSAIVAPSEGMGLPVCVTGAGGYIGSWLVKTLLENGHTVHATLRDPDNPSKNSCLFSLPGAQERLLLFRADLCEEGSFDSAIHGCGGVFHVATPTDFVSQDPENEIIEAAIRGTLNVLRSCKRVPSVRRVVCTSSLTAASTADESAHVDESLWSSVDSIRENKRESWFYAESKTLAEKAALEFGKEEGIHVISIVPPIIAGPFMTVKIPSSVHVTLSLITGDPLSYGLLQSIHFLPNTVSLIHVQDICNAHLFLMDHPSAEGRYLCSGHTITMQDFANFISESYPQYKITAKLDELQSASGGGSISSKKLLDLGFKYKYSLAEIIDDSIQYVEKLATLT